jgi:hypothetical protein
MLVGRCNVVGSTNDLNPASFIVVRRMELPQRRARSIAARFRSVTPAPERGGRPEALRRRRYRDNGRDRQRLEQRLQTNV